MLMSRPKTKTEQYARSLKMSVKDFTQAYDSLDYELISLRKWLDKLDVPLTVRRSLKDWNRFVFDHADKDLSSTVSYERARSFLAGLTYGKRYSDKAHRTAIQIAITEARDIREGIRTQDLSLAVIENSFYVIQDCLERILEEQNDKSNTHPIMGRDNIGK